MTLCKPLIISFLDGFHEHCFIDNTKYIIEKSFIIKYKIVK